MANRLGILIWVITKVQLIARETQKPEGIRIQLQMGTNQNTFP